MKKTSIILGLMTAGFMAFSQAPVRMSLFEEFTGENCGPCAGTNPGLNVVLNANSSKVIAIKWQVPIPSAPSATWSLYKTNQAEIDWRYRGTGAGGYGYPAQWTPTTGITSGINAAPTGVLDGKHQWQYGATSDHPFYLNATVINSAQAQPTNFSINMSPTWSPSFTSAVVAVTVTSSSNFTATGNMVFRLCLVERVINFATAPGTNGEKDFEDVVRKSYPTTITGTAVTSMGTSLSNTWTAGMTQTMSINCIIPSYINDMSQMAFVGFVQEDIAGNTNKPVYQAARSSQPSIPNDIKVTAVNAPIICTSTFQPSFVAQNLGTVAVTALTVVPYVDGAAQPTFTFAGNIAGGASATITLGTYSATSGAHTFSVDVTGVSGGDVNMGNNKKKVIFGVNSTVVNSPVVEPFNSFPPANWYQINADAGPAWMSGSPGGFGTGAPSAKYDFYNNGATGDFDDLYFPAVNLSGVAAPVLKFDVAYAPYTSGTPENDQLDVLVSTNCGASWTNVYSKAGTNLSTAAPYNAGAWVPSAAQWRTETVNVPQLANAANALVKFRATTDYGNNMYIDNVNLGAPTSIEKYDVNQVSFDVFPNPATTAATIKMYSANDQNVSIVIYNALGQTVKSMNSNLSFGMNEISVNTADLSTGVYNVVVNNGSASLVKKLTVNK